MSVSNKPQLRPLDRYPTSPLVLSKFANDPSCSQLALSSSVAWNEDGAVKESVVCSRVTRNHLILDQQIFVQPEKTFLRPHLEVAT